jgi:hypothetical protein
VKTTVAQRLVVRYLYAIDVMENSAFEMELPEDGDDKRRNASQYYLNDITRCMRSGALKRWLKDRQISSCISIFSFVNNTQNSHL